MPRLLLIGCFVILTASDVSGQVLDRQEFDTWIASRPAIESAIKWESEGIVTSYSGWTDSLKTRLYDTYSRMGKAQDLELTDPPANLHIEDSDDFLLTVFSHNDAVSLYFALVANSLILEINKTLPWSLSDYDSETLKQIFSSESFYPIESGIEFQGLTIPAPPSVVINFLNDNNIVADDRYSTIVNLLGWVQYKAGHYFWLDRESPAENALRHWGYRGQPPVSRIIEGRETGGDFLHWYNGCWGLSDFIQNILRVINIPSGTTPAGGHAHPYFPSEGLQLSHADDIQSQISKSAPGTIRPEEFFIDDKTFRKWFDPQTNSEQEIRVKLKGCGKKKRATLSSL